jgi:3',5'-cyclic AMP phosphodiesterase CpdA
MTTWHFLIWGDPQIGQNIDKNPNESVAMRESHKGIDHVAKYANEKLNIDFCITPGDLTHHGVAGNIFPFRDHEELQLYVSQFVKPFADHGITVYDTLGNHDVFTKFFLYKPVATYIALKHEATYNWIDPMMSGYYKFIKHGILFIMLGVYPKNTLWLIKNLPSDKSTPIILAWHYNILDDQAVSDWWTTDEKNKVYNIIQDYNIKLVINGHLHSTEVDEWHGIPNVIFSDDECGLVEMNDHNISSIKSIQYSKHKPDSIYTRHKRTFLYI